MHDISRLERLRYPAEKAEEPVNQNRMWVWVLIASLVALAVGFGAAWAVQQKKVDAGAEGARNRVESRATLASQDLAEANKALDAAIAERDRLQLQFERCVERRYVHPHAQYPPAHQPAPQAVGGVQASASATSRRSKPRAARPTSPSIKPSSSQGRPRPPPPLRAATNRRRPTTTTSSTTTSSCGPTPSRPAVKVTLTTEADNVNPDGYPSDLATLKAIFGGTNAALQNAKMSPYWFTLKSGVITAIAEQYLP